MTDQLSASTIEAPPVLFHPGSLVPRLDVDWYFEPKSKKTIRSAIMAPDVDIEIPQPPPFTSSLAGNAPLGVVAIAGGSGSGKTYVLRKFGVRTLHLHEPEGPVTTKDLVWNGLDLANRITVSGDVFAVDSLRGIQFSAQGAAGELGLIPSFFTRLTMLHWWALLNGKTIAVVLNPLHLRETYVENFKSLVDGSTYTWVWVDRGQMHIYQRQHGTRLYSWTGRGSSGEVEVNVPITLRGEADGSPSGLLDKLIKEVKPHE